MMMKSPGGWGVGGVGGGGGVIVGESFFCPSH